MLTLTKTEARRLAIAAQRLAGPRPLADPEVADPEGMLNVFRAISCVQIDPIRRVERSHWLVLWSRLGRYDPALFTHLSEEQRALFEAWAHCASIVLTEDYPLFYRWMHGRYEGEDIWSSRVRQWMEANASLRDHIFERLRADGPLTTRDFEDLAAVPWQSTGWTKGRNVARMLDFLAATGHIMVAGRDGNMKRWHLTEAWLPDWADRDLWPVEDVVALSAQKSLKALGVATANHIHNHFMRKSYPGLKTTLAKLLQDKLVFSAQILDNGKPLPGDWYVHRDQLPLLEQIRDGSWMPRTVLLSPFDNLICDRERTEQLFDFRFRSEIYVPKAKRQYGYYVLPILHGDRLIGRMDSTMDRKRRRYTIHQIYLEPEVSWTPSLRRSVESAIEELALFLGANNIVYPQREI
jgi:hypothetical protein